MSQNSEENSLAEMAPNSLPMDQSSSSATTTASLASSPATSLQSLSLATSISSETKQEKLQITLDSPTNTYYSGQTIRGTISLFSKQKKKVRGIYFRVLGYGKCSWSDFLRRESVVIDGKGERSAIKYTGTEEYLNSTLYIIGSKNGPAFTLPEGTTTYDFSFNLKSNLPSSYAGNYGKIKYKLEFVVDKPWKFDEMKTVVFNVIQTVHLNSTAGTLQTFENQLTRNIGYIGSGPISLHVYIEKAGYVPGEKLPIQVIVSNNSRVHVEKVKFTVNKVVDYHSKVPGITVKREISRLLKKEAGGVNKKTEQRYEHVIDVPETIPSQDANTSQLIHIKYEVKVEVKISGLYKNLVISAPLIIGNVPHSFISPRQVLFPALPDLPVGLSHRSPLPPAIGFNTNRSSLPPNHLPNDSSFIRSGSLSSHSSTSSAPQDSSRQSAHSIHSISVPTSTNAGDTATPNTSLNGPTTSSNVEYPVVPSAPPLDSYLDAPPSYDDVFGSPSTSTGFANSSMVRATAAKT